MSIISDLRANLHGAITRRMLTAWRPKDAAVPEAGAGGAFSAGPAAFLGAACRLYEKGLQKDQQKRRKKRVKLDAPVISIGNLSTGGTGKTPLTVWMCRFLLETGLHPAILTRGYGGKRRSPGRVPLTGNPDELSDIFGDEPVMLSRYLPSAPVWVGRNRAASGMAALALDQTDVLVLDDGFQHLELHRDLDMVLLDCRNPFGNGFVLPAGPLREPASHLGRADVFVITNAGEDARLARLKERLERLFPAIPVFSCRHKVIGISLGKAESVFDLGALSDCRAVVFAGIARPELFFEDLRNGGIKICRSFAFPDHHRYTAGDLGKIFQAASSHGAKLIITTAKDSVRIPRPFREALAVAEMGIDFGPDDENFRRRTMETIGARLSETGNRKPFSTLPLHPSGT